MSGAYDHNLDSLTEHVRRAREPRLQASSAPAPASATPEPSSAVFSAGLLASVDLHFLRAAANGDVERLWGAFHWAMTPQGFAHWRAIYAKGLRLDGGAPGAIPKADREWLADLVKAAEAAAAQTAGKGAGSGTA